MNWREQVLRLGRTMRVYACPFVVLFTLSRAEPVRVVSQTVGTDELLLAVAAPAQIAALSHLARERDFSAVVEAAQGFPVLDKGGDAENILQHRPTLVLVADYSRADLVKQIERAGVPVLKFTRYRTLADAFANLRMLAAVLGPEAAVRAEAVIADASARAEALAARLAGVRPVKVIAPSTYGVIGGAGTTFQDLCDHAGAENLAATLGGVVGHGEIPREQMLAWPVEQLVVAGYEVEAAVAPYLTLTPYRFMAAVKERRVGLIAPWMLSAVSHHRVAAYEALARVLHPEVFADE